MITPREITGEWKVMPRLEVLSVGWKIRVDIQHAWSSTKGTMAPIVMFVEFAFHGKSTRNYTSSSTISFWIKNDDSIDIEKGEVPIVRIPTENAIWDIVLSDKIKQLVLEDIRAEYIEIRKKYPYIVDASTKTMC